MPTSPADETVHAVVLVSGLVQGVGFRFWARYRADQLGLAGSAVNLLDGRVQIHAEGARARVERLLDDLNGGSTPGRVTGIETRWEPPTGDTRFYVG